MNAHDPRTCRLCAALRHPGTARQARELKAHLAKQPLPTQKGAGR
ncbi:hypothetical protein ACLVWQ_17655 (plasmid) [Streptomyces sp. CWNU-52B]